MESELRKRGGGNFSESNISWTYSNIRGRQMIESSPTSSPGVGGWILGRGRNKAGTFALKDRSTGHHHGNTKKRKESMTRPRGQEAAGEKGSPRGVEGIPFTLRR